MIDYVNNSLKNDSMCIFCDYQSLENPTQKWTGVTISQNYLFHPMIKFVIEKKEILLKIGLITH